MFLAKHYHAVAKASKQILQITVAVQIKSSLLYAKYTEKKRKRKHNHQLKKLILIWS